MPKIFFLAGFGVMIALGYYLVSAPASIPTNKNNIVPWKTTSRRIKRRIICEKCGHFNHVHFRQSQPILSVAIESKFKV